MHNEGKDEEIMTAIYGKTHWISLWESSWYKQKTC